MNANATDKNVSFVNSVLSSLSDSEGQSPDEIRESLKADGVDVDKVLKRLTQKVEELSQSARRKQLDFAKERRLAEKTKLTAQQSKFAGWSKEMILQEIERLTGGMGPQFAVSYRELNKCDVGDLRTILEDIETSKKEESE